MTWWQTMLVAGAPALITGGVLMLQLRMTSAAESRRHAQEREHAVRDHWREGRAHAHSEVLTMLLAADHTLRSCAYEIMVAAQGQSGVGPLEVEKVTPQDYLRLRAGLVQVKLYGGKATLERAEEAWRLFSQPYLRTSVIIDEGVSGGSVEGLDEEVDALLAMLDPFTAATERYLDAVRAELGTKD